MSPAEQLVFEVAGHHFAVPLAIVEEVVPASTITTIPNSPRFLLGLAAVRGRVMGVIDCALRYGLTPQLNSFFMVCSVRGNATAVTIDRPITAGRIERRVLDQPEAELLRSASKVDPKFIKGAYELLEVVDEAGQTRATGTCFLEVDPDLFVSAEMASRVGEAA